MGARDFALRAGPPQTDETLELLVYAPSGAVVAAAPALYGATVGLHYHTA